MMVSRSLAPLPFRPLLRRRRINSKNHEGDGENVLFNDGHCEWTTTSFVGANRDCIYSQAKVSGTPIAQGNPAASVGWPTSGQLSQPTLDLDSILIPCKGHAGVTGW